VTYPIRQESAANQLAAIDRSAFFAYVVRLHTTQVKRWRSTVSPIPRRFVVSILVTVCGTIALALAATAPRPLAASDARIPHSADQMDASSAGHSIHADVCSQDDDCYDGNP